MRKGAWVIGSLLFVAGGVVALGVSGQFPAIADAWSSLVSPGSAASVDVSGDPDAAALDAGPPRKQSAPLSSAQLAAPLVHGAFVTACGAPETMKVVAKVDVKLGKATSVSVKTEPPDPGVSACVETAIRGMQWDVSPKVGHATVTY